MEGHRQNKMKTDISMHKLTANAFQLTTTNLAVVTELKDKQSYGFSAKVKTIYIQTTYFEFIISRKRIEDSRRAEC